VEFLNFIFRIGVVFAIFGFIWGFIQLGYSLLRGKNNNIGETYLIKTLKYFFLVDVIFLFGYESLELNINQLLIIALILLTYFIGKLQNQQEKKQLFKVVASGLPIPEKHFNIKAEIAVIIISVIIFITFIFYPQYAENKISVWFHDSIIDIETTPIFGFIFKIIGFIFIVTLFMKLLTSINMMISGKKTVLEQSNNTDQKRKDDDFDDFVEIK
jgi:hypothetical protein